MTLILSRIESLHQTRGETSSNYDAANWLGNELEAEARVGTPVPGAPTLDELRSADRAAGE